MELRRDKTVTRSLMEAPANHFMRWGRKELFSIQKDENARSVWEGVECCR